MAKIDETNREIIRELRDGRKPFSVIAEKLNITENTVRSRVNKLVESDVLTISGLVNPEAVSDIQVVILGIKLKTFNLEKKADEFASLHGVISVAVVTGRYDMILQVALRPDTGFNLSEFMRKELERFQDDILTVETFVAYQFSNYLIPFVD